MALVKQEAFARPRTPHLVTFRNIVNITKSRKEDIDI